MPGKASIGLCEDMYECFGITTAYIPESDRLTHTVEAEFELASDCVSEWTKRLCN